MEFFIVDIVALSLNLFGLELLHIDRVEAMVLLGQKKKLQRLRCC